MAEPGELTEEPLGVHRVHDAEGRVWLNTGDPAELGAANWELETNFNEGVFEPESWARVCESAPIRVW